MNIVNKLYSRVEQHKINIDSKKREIDSLKLATKLISDEIYPLLITNFFEEFKFSEDITYSINVCGSIVELEPERYSKGFRSWSDKVVNSHEEKLNTYYKIYRVEDSIRHLSSSSISNGSISVDFSESTGYKRVSCIALDFNKVNYNSLDYNDYLQSLYYLIAKFISKYRLTIDTGELKYSNLLRKKLKEFGYA